MKKLSFLFLGLVLLLSSGCPVGLDYPLVDKGQEKIDQGLLGTWDCENTEGEVLSVKIEAQDENHYKVTVLERGSMYALETDNLTGWVTKLGGGHFLILQPENEDKFYHYQYQLENGTLISNDVSLLDGGVDAVTSVKSLREQVEKSMSMSGWADEKQTWVKE